MAATVPHHADGSWPVTDERLTLGDTCFRGAGSTPLVSLPDAPTDGDGEAGPEDFDGWRRDELSDDEAALLDDVGADPWVRRVGVALTPPSMRDGDSRRFGSSVTGTLPAGDPDPRRAVAAVVDEMTAWEPTWVSCTSTGTVDVRLRLVTGHGVATARVLQDPASGAQVSWSIAVPVPEAPVPTRLTQVPALTDPACLGPDPLPRALTLEGEPVAVPVRLQPVID